MTQDAKPAAMPDEDAESETEQDVSELARSVVQELEPGTMVEDKLILSRRQALAIATGTVSASALIGSATRTAEAQSAAGQVGTKNNPVDIEAADLNFQGSITKNGSQFFDNTIAAPTPTAYLSGPTHGEGAAAFQGATLAPDGRVIFAPFGSSNVGIFDPATDSYTSGPTHGEGGGAFIGATLSPDGRVIFAPRNSSNVGIFDPATDSYTSGPTHGEGSNAFRGATLAPDGRVIFAPNDSSNVGIVSQLLSIATANTANR